MTKLGRATRGVKSASALPLATFRSLPLSPCLWGTSRPSERLSCPGALLDEVIAIQASASDTLSEQARCTKYSQNGAGGRESIMAT